jgi:signal transduction histidine kinase
LLLASNTTPKLSSQSNSEDAMTSSNTTEARLAAGTELAGLGYYEIDYGKCTCFLDDRFRELCGVPPDLQQGLGPVQFWMEHVHPGDLQHLLGERQELHDGKVDRISAEYRYLHPVQGQKWIHHLARIAERSTTAGEVRTFGVLRDITEQHRSEEAIHDLSARLIGAQEEERARLARELHDGLSQSLALQAVQLDLMALRPPATAAEFAGRLQELSAQMKRLSTEVHRISHDLHPAKLTQLGLAAAIAELCQAGLSAHQIPISFHHRGIPRSLPLGVALCLYRVAQESIQNVVKHSGAKNVKVELTLVKNEIELCVADDGRGFDVELSRHTQSLGLVSMRERVRAVHGQIRIQSKPGEGTRVTVSLPVPAETKR